MNVRVHIVDASSGYSGGLINKDVASIVFDAPGNIVPQVRQKQVIMFDLYVNDANVTVRRMLDTLVVTFS
ncbi:hypothetical protein LCGC14_1054090 [marine sediment metagenome]|uniref:Uncharacterized protein n=1 Tax=marine sediment metagenome TaxID=412755 RepID=A0A0F9MMZ5_9ZZZZ